jgi:hypothetical protein
MSEEGLEALNADIRRGITVSAQTGPRSEEPQPAIANPGATGFQNMAPVPVADVLRGHPNLLQQAFLVTTTTAPTNNDAGAAPSAQQSPVVSAAAPLHQSPQQPQRHSGPYVYVGQQRQPKRKEVDHDDDDPYKAQRAYYVGESKKKEESESKKRMRKPDICRECGHFRDVGPFGVDKFHHWYSPPGQQVIKNSRVKCFVSEDDKLKHVLIGWCSCDKCKEFATDEIFEVFFPEGSRGPRLNSNKRSRGTLSSSAIDADSSSSSSNRSGSSSSGSSNSSSSGSSNNNNTSTSTATTATANDKSSSSSSSSGSSSSSSSSSGSSSSTFGRFVTAGLTSLFSSSLDHSPHKK